MQGPFGLQQISCEAFMTVPLHPMSVPLPQVSAFANNTHKQADRRSGYRRLVNGCFVLFNCTRLLTYLPTLWAIHSSASSSQHSLLTWGVWVGSNLSMAAWLYEHHGRQLSRAVVVTLGNAVMCFTTCLFISAYRWGGPW
jgi:hypothetical protein